MNMHKSMLLINFKTYENGIGDKALKLARTAENVAKELDANISVVIEPASIYRIMQSTNIRIFSQHIDPHSFGPNTGHIIAESIKENGAYGVLLNHSEKRIEFDTLKKCLKRCREVGLKTVVCVQNMEETRIVACFHPDFMALEFPVLIGSGKSISKITPNSVKRFVKTLKEIDPKIIPLCGAGISSKDDVKAALSLGVNGVLVSSVVVNSPDSKKVIRELAEGLINNASR